jgi:class 3 adenylate cyclase
MKADRASEIAALEAGIAALEQQRVMLGDEVVDGALAPLRSRLIQLTAAAPPGDLEGERKVVTVLFADVSGFTALAERLDPEAVRALMNRCFERMVPIIQRHGGTIDKFIGDAVLALFGAPVTRDKDAHRALYASLELRDAVRQLSGESGFDLSLHVGVNTGLVVAGEVGSRERHQYSVMGDAVNLAARLEDASSPWSPCG